MSPVELGDNRILTNFGQNLPAVTKKKCTVKIVSNSKSTLAPVYLGVWNYYKYITPKVEKFFFALKTLNVVSKDHVASESTNSL